MVDAPALDQAFLTDACWQTVPSLSLVRAIDGDAAALPTRLRLAWSLRGLHICFDCVDPLPLCQDFACASAEDEEWVGVFLDPVGERSTYMALLVSPYGRVIDARVENRLHHTLHREEDDSWSCPGLRVRSWSGRAAWSVELLIPFTGITPALDIPHPGNRWVANFYRVERLPLLEISAWQPVYTTPPDLHATEHFGILVFGNPC